MSGPGGAVAISAGAVAANNAMMRAREISECRAFMPRFNAAAASVSEMQRYAHCVNLIYPKEPLPVWLLVVCCVLIVAAIVPVGVLVWQSFKDYFWRPR